MTPRLHVELCWLGVLALLWGSSYLLIKAALTGFPPITLIALRVAIAALFLLAVMCTRRERLPRDPVTWRRLFVQAIFNSIGAWTVLAWGQQYVDSGLASVLNSTSPVFVFLITAFVTRHEPAGPLRLAGAALGILGVVLIVGTGALRGLGAEVAGQLAVLAGAVLYAGAAIYGRRFSALPPTVTAAGTMIWATLCLGPLSLALDRPWTLAPSAQAIAATLVLGILCTGAALLIYFRLVRTIGSMGVASQSYLRAGVGVVLGVTVLGETITPAIGAGLACTIGGVALINLAGRGKRRVR